MHGAAGRASTPVGGLAPWGPCAAVASPARAPSHSWGPAAARTLHSSRVCLGRLEQQGLHKEAMRHMTRALKINTKAFGEEHASTKDTAANLDRLRDEM